MLRELELTNFKGVATNIAQPDKTGCILNKNLDVHEKPGTLTLRRGYSLKYSKPSDLRITNSEFISFDNFYEKTAIADGREITVQVEQGIVKSEESFGNFNATEYFLAYPDKTYNLAYGIIVLNSEVLSSSNGEIIYLKDFDYTVDYQNNTFTVLGTGTITVHTSLTIDYKASGINVVEEFKASPLLIHYLGQGTIIPGTDVLSNEEIIYLKGTDYTIDTINNSITTLSTIATSTLLTLNYVVSTELIAQPNIWVRPYWDNGWVDNWQWLNEIVITKIKTTTDAIYKSYIELTTTKANDYFVGWTLWNKTQNLFSQVITSKLITGGNRINHTLYNSVYDVDDTIYLFKNYIDKDYMSEMYNATSAEIVYHEILNDIRIGFGGKKKRVGLSIGYRKKYFKIKSINFTKLHSDLSSDGTTIKPSVLTAFSKIDGLILDEYSLISKVYGVELQEGVPISVLPAETYFFKLTGTLDNNSEILLADNVITTTTTKDIEVKPYLATGKINKRLTGYKIYYSTDGNTYFKLSQIDLSSHTNDPTRYIIDMNGRLILEDVEQIIAMTDSASSPADINDTGDWFATGVQSLTVETGTVSNFSIRVVVNPSTNALISAGITGLISGQEYNLGITAISDKLSYSVVSIYFANKLNMNGELSNKRILPMDISYPIITTLIPTTNAIDCVVIKIENNSQAFLAQLDFDNLKIVAGEGAELLGTTAKGNEMSIEMGYVPSYNLVKDWEQCLVFQGRSYFLNPYIEKQWDNFIMKSHIGAGFMYDAASAGEFLEVNKPDSSKAIGMALLMNGNLLILKSKSTMTVDPDNNFIRDYSKGKGCVSREAIVTLANSIVWSGLEDIYVLSPNSGAEVHGILENSIRDIYLADTNLEGIIAIRDKYNTYRFRVYNKTNKNEFLMTKRGWIEEVKYLFAEMYRIGIDNVVWFSNNGDIYVNDR